VTISIMTAEASRVWAVTLYSVLDMCYFMDNMRLKWLLPLSLDEGN
jgi:hypothetical protein